jgi:excisionase family DNA binding protein
MNDEKIMRVKEASTYLGVSESTIRKYVLEKSIPFIKINGIIRFDLNDIENWLEKGKVPILKKRSATTTIGESA